MNAPEQTIKLDTCLRQKGFAVAHSFLDIQSNNTERQKLDFTR
jgi:hypothetical protein